LPLQNRVRPDGEIVATPERGLLTGNRGCLHRADRRLGKARWRSPAWLCCLLAYKDWYHGPMPPRRWTALFFLDEATALAAGHRPCAACRREDWRLFLQAWADGHGLARPPSTAELDHALHAQRLEQSGKRSILMPAEHLPHGAMYREPGGSMFLVTRDGELRWSFAGYANRRERQTGVVEVLTPEGTLAALGAGYRPRLHPSAGL
jgi:hypothetical protein